jgi:ATP-dependent RNA helicase DeaD
MGLINEQTRNRHVEIGKIDILPNVTYFEINSAYENELKKAFSTASFEGVNLKIKFSESGTSAQNHNRPFAERRKRERVRQYR